MTYEILDAHLQNNHIYPIPERKNGKIISLHVSADPIMKSSKKERLEIILSDYPVTISEMKNESYILIKLKNKK